MGRFCKRKIRELGKKVPQGTRGARGTLNKLVSLVGKVFKSFFKLVFKIGKPIVFFVGILLMIALFVSWIGAIVSLVFGNGFLQALLPSGILYNILTPPAILIAIGVPIITLGLTISRWFFGYNIKNKWKGGLGSLWVGSVVALSIIGGLTAKQFSNSQVLVDEKVASTITSDTIFVDASLRGDYNKFSAQFDNIAIEGERIINEDVHFVLEKSKDNQVHIDIIRGSDGASSAQARSLAEAIEYSFEGVANKLTFPSYFETEKKSKYRAQYVVITLQVPESKTVVFEPDARYMLDKVEQKRSGNDIDYTWAGHHRGRQIFSISGTGFTTADWENKKDKVIQLSEKDFDRLDVDARLKVEIEQADAFEMTFIGQKAQLDKLNFERVGGRLFIEGNLDHWSKSVLKVKMPTLTSFKADNSRKVVIKGFEGGTMDIDFNSRHEQLDAFVSVVEMKVHQSNASTVELKGSADKMITKIDRGSTLDASSFEVRIADLSKTFQGHHRVNVSETVYNREKLYNFLDVIGSAKIIEPGDE